MRASSSDIISELVEKTCKNGADAADCIWFDTVDISINTRKLKQESLERSEGKALGLRAFVGNSQAIISTTDFSKNTLETLAEKLIAMARATPPDADSSLADERFLAKNPPDLDLCDPDEPDVAWLSEQCLQAETKALSFSGISNSEGADASYGLSNITLATANRSGLLFCQTYPTSHFSLSVSVIAGQHSEMQRDYAFSTARHRNDLRASEILGEEAAGRALARLHPRKIASCNVPVLFDKRVSRNLLSAFAGCISGSAVSRKASFLKDDLGKAVFAHNITIMDDPLRRRGISSKPFDGEGTTTQLRTFVDNGVLQSWLLDTRTAKKLGFETTGSATRSIASPPSPSTSNFYMQAGEKSPQALMKEMQTGLLVTETFGMGINHVTGDYSQGAAGFWVENGEIAYPVSEITIAGHLRAMYRNAIPANDLEFTYATNCPSLLVDGMTIAGI